MIEKTKPRGPGEYPGTVTERVRALRDRGYAPAGIARMLGIPRREVDRALRRLQEARR